MGRIAETNASITCSACGKRGRHTRRAAKKIARLYPGTSVYLCASGSGLWHIGNLPQVVKRGLQSRDGVRHIPDAAELRKAARV